jgi:cytosine/adenosine deaminase-related metal-dependent hydrolase
MTGYVNAHTHLYSGLVPFGLPSQAPQRGCRVGDPAGTPPAATFLDVLQRFWWRLDRALDEQILRASARYHVAEALLHGTHTLVDHHESPCLMEDSLDILGDACQELGIRAVLCYGATERNEGRLEAERGLAECRRFIRENQRPLVRGVVGLHASFTVSDETIREAGDLCRELDTVMHLHAAEDRCDAADARERGYTGVVDRLHRLGALVPGSILAHGVHLTRAEVECVASRGCWLVQNPRSNEQNRVGYPAALGASALVALGTDGFASDMAAERDEGTRLAVAHGESREVVDGRLEAGERLAAERFQWREDSIEVSGADACRLVDRLVIAGRVVVEKGRLLTGDWEAIRAEAAEQAKRLSARMREIGRW